jgi:hypothetical protein
MNILLITIFALLNVGNSHLYTESKAVINFTSSYYVTVKLSSLVTASATNTFNASEIGQIYFKDLRKYRMNANQAPEELKKFDGQTIQIVGFMVPFDSIERIERFILLQAPFMGCYHLPPPQPNESVLVNSAKIPADYIYEPIRITGTLKIEETYVERYLVALYSIEATKIEIVSQDDAELEGLPANFHMFGEF